ncbi:MAG: hypothetical protein IKS70_03150, partial [Bacteroides sp.]|nr:hypothetical protein [Bacteroides sp.]
KYSWSTYNWWIPGGGTETLELGFAKQKVGGIVFYTYSKNQKFIRSVQVSVSEDDGSTYFVQGTVIPSATDTVYIAFNKPVEINKIKFSNFESWNSSDSFVDIHEIEVYTTETDSYEEDDSGDDDMGDDDEPEDDETGDDESEDDEPGGDDSEDDASGGDDSGDDDSEDDASGDDDPEAEW